MKSLFHFHLSLLILIILPSFQAISNDSEIIKLYLKNNATPPQMLDSLSFGIHYLATDSIDTDLGEKDYPPIGLPADIFMAYLITYDARQQQDVWTWHDFRPFAKDSQHFYREYKIKLFFGEGSAVTIRWDNLSSYIDSAKVQDPFAAYYDIDMKDTNQFTTTEILLDEFVFKVWFNTTGTSVYDNNFTNSLVVFPNPTRNILNIAPNIQSKSLILYDYMGNVIKRFDIKPMEYKIILPNLDFGVYFVNIIDIFGNIYSDKIIIQ